MNTALNFLLDHNLYPIQIQAIAIIMGADTCGQFGWEPEAMNLYAVLSIV